MKLFGKALERLAESLSTPLEAAEYALEPEPAETYRLPGAPPTGRHVLTANGCVYRRESHASEEFLPWGAWLLVRDPEAPHGPDPDGYLSWAQLLELGPLTLLPESEYERAQAVLYGPAGARWGDPDTPCPYKECTLGTNHIGTHKDVDGNPLGVRPVDTDGRIHNPGITPHMASRVFCTCGSPAMHKPDCPRYSRMTGEQEETPNEPSDPHDQG